MSDIDRIERWELFGGTWRVVSDDGRSVSVALCRCDTGEEAERLASGDPALRDWLAERDGATSRSAT